MTPNEKIKKLEQQIADIRKANDEEVKAKYSYLVGKYLHRAHTSYEKITAIDRVSIEDFGDEITFDCVYVYFDDRKNIVNQDASISLGSYGQIESTDIERYLISKEVFDTAFNKCFEFIKNKTMNQ